MCIGCVHVSQQFSKPLSAHTHTLTRVALQISIITVTFSKSAHRVEMSSGHPFGLKRATCCWPMKSMKSVSPGSLGTRPHVPPPHGVSREPLDEKVSPLIPDHLALPPAATMRSARADEPAPRKRVASRHALPALSPTPQCHARIPPLALRFVGLPRPAPRSASGPMPW